MAGHDFVEAGVLVHLEVIGEVRACVMLLDSKIHLVKPARCQFLDLAYYQPLDLVHH